MYFPFKITNLAVPTAVRSLSIKHVLNTPQASANKSLVSLTKVPYNYFIIIYICISDFFFFVSV